jgi:hypothetical protein
MKTKVAIFFPNFREKSDRGFLTILCLHFVLIQYHIFLILSGNKNCAVLRFCKNITECQAHENIWANFLFSMNDKGNIHMYIKHSGKVLPKKCKLTLIIRLDSTRGRFSTLKILKRVEQHEKLKLNWKLSCLKTGLTTSTLLC